MQQRKTGLSDEQMAILHRNRLIYLLDTYDSVLDELIDEFVSAGQPLLGSLFAGMRLHMYIHGEKLGIDNKNRTISLETMRDKMLEQQRLCTEIVTGKIYERE
jgi:hypothetical protein